MKSKLLSQKNRKWILAVAVLVILVAAGTTAYLLLRPHSKTVAQVNGVIITQEALDQQVVLR